jgi:putrescine transport system permease protein
MNRRPSSSISCLCFGFAFFYIPILSMIVYSFNRSAPCHGVGRLLDAMVWQASSRTTRSGRAAILSLQIAVVSATFATILGTMAGIALARFRRFRGRLLFSGMVTAPLVMPEVITGISSLMLFILMAEWIGWPGSRGFTTDHPCPHHLLDGLS